MRLLFSILLVVIFSACSSSLIEKNSVRLRGPESMKDVILKLSEAFIIDNPSIQPQVNFSKNSKAIEELIDNDADIVFSTRIFSVEETKLIAQKFHSIGVTTIFARDIIHIIVNYDNLFENISNRDLLSILTCTNISWDFFTKNDAAINIYMLTDFTENDSPINRLLLKNQSLCKSINVLDNANKITDMVFKNKNAIGITGLISDEKVKPISLNGIFPGENEIRNRRYPLEYYLNFLTLTEPQGSSKIFIDWVLSSKGQKIIEELGYGALFTTTH